MSRLVFDIFLRHLNLSITSIIARTLDPQMWGISNITMSGSWFIAHPPSDEFGTQVPQTQFKFTTLSQDAYLNSHPAPFHARFRPPQCP
jgi:hypothetical protein